MRKGPLVPYMTLGETEEVMQTLLVDKDGNTYPGPIEVYFEKPDKIFGCKNARFNLDDMTIMERYGYTDSELSDLVTFLDRNKESIIYYANRGGIYYAEMF